MSKVRKKIEDLKVLPKGYELVLEVYKITHQ